MMTDANGKWPLPEGWVWKTLSSITQPILKIRPESEPEKVFTYLDISGIDNYRNVIAETKSYRGADAPSRARQQVRSGDVLFSTVRTYLKNIAVVPDVYDGQVASTGFSILRGESGVVGKYIFYYTLTEGFLDELSKLQRGSSYPAVRDNDVREQLIPLAPLPEQHRIVAEIEKQFTRLDAAVAALKRAKASLARYKAAVLKAAVEGWLVAQDPDDEPAAALLERILAERRAQWAAANPKKKYVEPKRPDVEGLGELPVGWVWAGIDSLISRDRPGMKTGPFGSLLKKHEHRNEGIPVLGIENIESMKFISGSKIHVSRAKAEELSGYDVLPGDVLVSRSGTVGEVCVVPPGLGEARFSTNLMRIVLDQVTILPTFFCYIFNGSPFVLDQISELCSGSTRDFLNQTILKSLVLPVPPLIEQKRIIKEVERQLSLFQASEQVITVNLARVERLRQGVLGKAFRGELVANNDGETSEVF